jgi:hypothetical protein
MRACNLCCSTPSSCATRRIRALWPSLARSDYRFTEWLPRLSPPDESSRALCTNRTPEGTWPARQRLERAMRNRIDRALDVPPGGSASYECSATPRAIWVRKPLRCQRAGALATTSRPSDDCSGIAPIPISCLTSWIIPCQRSAPWIDVHS